ncbi:MAG: hypothetical protein P1S60_06045 [Anaerolineae bacterium]|nr:hypothetical protein [Anaerolineae bacterium]
MDKHGSLNRIRAFGIVLIILGCLALIDQVLNIHYYRYIWPVFIIIPGIWTFFTASKLGYGGGEPFAMLGAMITMVGLIFWVQSVTGLWASWAYAWALVAPTSVGLGQLLYNNMHQHRYANQSGMTLINIGLIMFLAGIIFFELILNLSGFGRNPVVWAAVFIGTGIIVLFRGFIPRQRN